MGARWHNLGTVVRFEFRRTITKRRFWLATLAVPVLIGVLFGLIVVSNSATSQSAAEQKNARFTFTYTDASGLLDPALVTQFGGTRAADLGAGIAAVQAGTLEAFFAYPTDPTTEPVRVYGAEKGVFENGKYASVAQALLQASIQARIASPLVAGVAQGHVRAETLTYQDGQLAPGFGAVIPPGLYLVIFYGVILLLGNQMLAATLEEKENRVTEMILTTINATSLILGKIISLFLIGLVQMLVFASPLVLGYLFARQQLSLPDLPLSSLVLDPPRMVLGAFILLGGFALFTGSLVALGAAMPTTKEAGPIFGALIMLIFIPFYALSLIVSDPNAPISAALTYFPYTAPITALLRNAVGTLPLTSALIVITILYGLAAVVLLLAVRLFRYGSLEYTRKVSLNAVLPHRRHPIATATAPTKHR